MNDLSGTQGSSRIPFPDRSVSAPSEDLMTETTSFDAKVYEGLDTISQMPPELVTQKTIDRKMYEAAAQNPELFMPEPDSELGPRPYAHAERKLVLKFFEKRVKELLAAKKGLASDEEMKAIYQSLISGRPLGNAKLANIANLIRKQALEETRKEAHLPEEWTPQSTLSKDWEPTPIAPYSEDKQREINAYYDQAIQAELKKYIDQATPPLTKHQIELLTAALSGGKVRSEIAATLTIISKAAADQTQKAFGLSNTWFRGTEIVEDWKPVNLGPLNLTAVNEARGQLILDNVEKVMNDFDKAGAKILEGLDINDPNRVTMDAFRKAISKAIRELKDVLRNIQLHEGDKTHEAAQAKLEAVQARTKKLQSDIKKREEIEEKRRKGEKISKIMKIAGPTVAVLSIVVGAALLLVTGGASAGLIIAGIAVGSAMAAYSVVDSLTGSTQKLITAFNELMEKAFPDNPMAQKILKAVIISAVVVVIVTLVVATGGGAAASVAAQVIRESLKQLAIQAVIMAVMASNTIPELLREILLSAGVDEKTSQICEIIIMVITMLLVMIATSAGKGGANAPKGAAEGVNSAGRSVKQFADNSVKLLKDLITNLKKGIVEGTIIESLRTLLRQLQTSLNSTIGAIATDLAQLPEKIKLAVENSIRKLNDVIKAILDLLKDIQKNPSQISEGIIDSLKTAETSLKNAIKQFRDAMNQAAIDAAKYIDDAKLGTKVTEEINRAKTKVTEMTQNLANNLASVPGHIGQAATDILKGIREIGRGYGSLGELLYNIAKIGNRARLGEDFTELLPVARENLIRGGLSVQRTLTITPAAIGIVDGINRGILGLQVVKLLKEVGEIKEAIELLQALIQMLEKLLAGIQSGMDARGELILSLQRFYNEFYSGLGRNTSKIFQTLHV